LQWQCKQGHLFQLLASEVRQGAWCPQCTGKAELKQFQKLRGENEYNAEAKNTAPKPPKGLKKRFSKPDIVQSVQRIAENKGGKWLFDTSYSPFRVQRFQCEQGHI